MPSATRSRLSGIGLRALDGVDERRRRELAESLEDREVLDAQGEQVRHVAIRPVAEELGDALFAETLDVERPARREVHDLLAAVGRDRRD